MYVYTYINIYTIYTKPLNRMYTHIHAYKLYIPTYTHIYVSSPKNPNYVYVCKFSHTCVCTQIPYASVCVYLCSALSHALMSREKQFFNCHIYIHASTYAIYIYIPINSYVYVFLLFIAG